MEERARVELYESEVLRKYREQPGEWRKLQNK
jgi:hypothetical protein